MIRRFWGFSPVVIKRGNPPSVPDDENELLELIRQRFEVLSRNTITKLGTTVENEVVLRCPFCKSEFTGKESAGCFHYFIVPTYCPVCKFPRPLFERLEELRRNEGYGSGS